VSAENSFYRFSFIVKDSIVYLLTGFKKKTNKWEQKEIKLAENRAKQII